MQIQIGCVDGQTYESDYMSDADLEKQMQAQDGQIGTGYLADTQFTLDGIVELIEDLLQNAFNYDKSVLSLTINGQNRIFQARHVVWWEIKRDQTEARRGFSVYLR